MRFIFRREKTIFSCVYLWIYHSLSFETDPTPKMWRRRKADSKNKNLSNILDSFFVEWKVQWKKWNENRKKAFFPSIKKNKTTLLLHTTSTLDVRALFSNVFFQYYTIFSFSVFFKRLFKWKEKKIRISFSSVRSIFVYANWMHHFCLLLFCVFILIETLYIAVWMVFCRHRYLFC